MVGKISQLLIYEHVSGGGLSNARISQSILSEGYGMLRCLVSDCKAAEHDVTTLLDSRLTPLKPPIDADRVVSVSSIPELDKNLGHLSGAVDAVCLIAPESDQTLQRLVELVEDSGGLSLNCRVDAIKRVSNKMTAYEILRKRRLVAPKTVMISLREDIKRIKQATGELSFPIVFKPISEVGCCGLSVVKDERQIAAAARKIVNESSSSHFIVQELVQGISVSASVISTGKRALPVTLNKQIVTLMPPYEESSYSGGIVPFDHVLEKEALQAARTAVESIGGLRGYIGVDMVLTKDGPVVIEVNPRFTTSFVGLRRAVSFNPAQAIIDAVLWRRLPKNPRTEGYAYFSKVKTPPTRRIFRKACRLKEAVSPPFPIALDEPAYALLAVHSSKLRSARTAFYRARKSLLEHFDRGN